MLPFYYRQEVYRKLIHLSSLWMPVAIYLLEEKTVLWIFAIGIVAVIGYEIIRRQDNLPAHLLDRIVGAALRPEEKERRFKPSGAIYVLAAAFLSTLIFPQLVAITAMAMMLTGDTAAALVGRRLGVTRVFNKSLEGAVAFFAAAFATAVIIAENIPAGNGYLPAAFVAAIAAALVELVSGKIYIDDNLSVPLAAGLVMMLIIRI